MTLRLAYNTNGFAHHALDDCFEILAELGYVGVALSLDVHHLDPYRTSLRERQAVRRRLESLGLSVTIETGARFLLDTRRKHRPGLLDADGFERRIAFLERAMVVAADLEAPVVTFSCGVADPSYSDDEAWARLVDRCRGLAERAAALGVVASFEPEPDFFVETLAQFRRLHAEVDHPALRLTLDIGHAHLLEEPPIADRIAECADVLAHVHLEDMRRPVHHHLALGEGEIDFAPVMRQLATLDYSGLIALELSRDSHRGPEVAKSAMSLLREHLA